METFALLVVCDVRDSNPIKLCVAAHRCQHDSAHTVLGKRIAANARLIA
jgi:hypothetical protein